MLNARNHSLPQDAPAKRTSTGLTCFFLSQASRSHFGGSIAMLPSKKRHIYLSSLSSLLHPLFFSDANRHSHYFYKAAMYVQCVFDGCINRATCPGFSSFCKKHGGGYQCSHPDCPNQAQDRGLYIGYKKTNC